jgi:hypothetical protein
MAEGPMRRFLPPEPPSNEGGTLADAPPDAPCTRAGFRGHPSQESGAGPVAAVPCLGALAGGRAHAQFQSSRRSLDLAERLRKEQGAPLEAPFLVEGVHFLAVEGAVELEVATSDREGELLDPLNQQGGDASATVIAVDDQLVHVPDCALMAQAALHRERPESDDPRIELGAQVPLTRRRKPALEHSAQGRFAKRFVRPVLTQQLEDGPKIL